MVRRVRTALFTPGTEAERLRKALASDADICIFDLEDSVPPGSLSLARETVATALEEATGSGRIFVRIHGASHPDMANDLAALPLSRLAGIVLPKVDHPDQLDACRAAVTARGGAADLPVIAIVESAEGALNAQAVARAPALLCLALGRFDLAADLGIDPDQRTPALSATRALLVLASAAAGLQPPLDSPWLAIKDLAGLRAAAEVGRREGFGGMLLIHPSHVEPVNRVFSPTAEEIAWAEGIVAASQAEARQGRGAFTRDGAMVDEAVVRRARRILNERIS
jgi:citrate lyase beta subunit